MNLVVLFAIQSVWEIGAIVLHHETSLDALAETKAKTNILQSKDRTKLQGIPMANYLPNDNKLKKKKLLRILGGDFDDELMSIEDPGASNNVPDSKSYADSYTSQRTIKKVRELIRKNTNSAKLTNESAELLTSFMLKVASCQIVFEWEDQGVLFWPRYIRTGTCISHGSCSWPPGMTCVPSETKTLHVLRWRCRRSRPGKKKKKIRHSCGDGNRNSEVVNRRIECKWKRIPYEVTEMCACKC